MELTSLKTLRKAKGVTIKTLEKETGINRDRISQIERGVVNPSFESVVKIIDALGCGLEITWKG